MARTQRSREGYLLIDHSNSPGVKPSDIGGAVIPGIDSKIFEAATFTCPHCHQQCVAFRKRSARKTEPNWCSKCDSRVCDRVACRLHCRNLNSVLDRLMERAFKFIGRDDTAIHLTDGV